MPGQWCPSAGFTMSLTTHASTALTLHIRAPIAISTHALLDGNHFVAIPSKQLCAHFTCAPTRTCVDPQHHYSITLDSHTSRGEPFSLPGSPVKPPPKKKAKGIKAPPRPLSAPYHGSPRPPPPGFHPSTPASDAPIASAKAPRANGSVPHTLDARPRCTVSHPNKAPGSTDLPYPSICPLAPFFPPRSRNLPSSAPWPTRYSAASMALLRKRPS